jgi:hypothetical protein
VLLAAAGPYLKMFGLVTGGWLMARSAAAALKHGPPDVLVTARFYAEQLLPQAGALIGAVTAGPRDLFAVDFS